MARAETLRPVDLPVALHLAMTPADGYEHLGEALGLSTSAAHRSVGRLEKAELLVRGKRVVILDHLKEFVVHGARYAFYAIVGPETVGVPTGTTEELERTLAPGGTQFVWPTAKGRVRGVSITPLYPQAIQTPDSHPHLYQLLALIDALRVGQARERREAAALLRKKITSWTNGTY